MNAPIPYSDFSRLYPWDKPEPTTVHITIPTHRHDMPHAAYLPPGHLTVEERDTVRKATYRAGEAFAESAGSVHRGVTSNEPAVVIVDVRGHAQPATLGTRRGRA